MERRANIFARLKNQKEIVEKRSQKNQKKPKHVIFYSIEMIYL